MRSARPVQLVTIRCSSTKFASIFVEFQIAGFEEYESRLNSVKTELEEGDPSVTVRPFCMAILSGSLKIFHVTIYI